MIIISKVSIARNDLNEFRGAQLFDDPKLFDDPQLFDDQLEVWILIIQKSTVIPSSPMVLFIFVDCFFLYLSGRPSSSLALKEFWVKLNTKKGRIGGYIHNITNLFSEMM